MRWEIPSSRLQCDCIDESERNRVRRVRPKLSRQVEFRNQFGNELVELLPILSPGDEFGIRLSLERRRKVRLGDAIAVEFFVVKKAQSPVRESL